MQYMCNLPALTPKCISWKCHECLDNSYPVVVLQWIWNALGNSVIFTYVFEDMRGMQPDMEGICHLSAPKHTHLI